MSSVGVPRLEDGRFYITEGGVETEIMYKHGFDFPHFCAFELLKDPDAVSHRDYFRAAEYYLHNNKDLSQSLNWINDALLKSENNFRYGLLKSKIFAAQGNKEQANENPEAFNQK